MSLGRVWSVLSSGPHPSGDSTDDHLRCRIIMIGWPGMSWFWVWWICHKTPSKLVNLLTQPFSNRFHNNLAYLNLQDWHLESGMKIMEDSQRKWGNNEGALLKENLRINCCIFGKWCVESHVYISDPTIPHYQIS